MVSETYETEIVKTISFQVKINLVFNKFSNVIINTDKIDSCF